MAGSQTVWKKGRGRLGMLQPLIGSWQATAESEMGPVVCTRTFSKVLDGKFVQLRAEWQLPESSYEELAFIGVGPGKAIQFWSFTSDGKSSQGTLADVTDIHPEAVGFEADMPAGRARMAYWPDAQEGFH